MLLYIKYNRIYVPTRTLIIVQERWSIALYDVSLCSNTFCLLCKPVLSKTLSRKVCNTPFIRCTWRTPVAVIATQWSYSQHHNPWGQNEQLIATSWHFLWIHQQHKSSSVSVTLASSHSLLAHGPISRMSPSTSPPTLGNSHCTNSALLRYNLSTILYYH
jgi:hypothetical protein